MNEFLSIETRKLYTRVAERYRQLRADPDLAPLHDVVILNRLHSEGFDIALDGMLAALEYSTRTGEGNSAVLPTRAAAEYLGIKESVFKVWFMSARLRGVKPPPEGTPVPERLGERGVGKAALWSVESLDATKAYLESHR